MPEYVKDEGATLERLGELVEAVRFAEYELTAAVALLKVIGMPWEQVGEGMGFAEGGRKQGASQWFKRKGPTFGLTDAGTKTPCLSMLEGDEDGRHSERARIARVLGLGHAKTRYQVRLVTGGKRGITKVQHRLVSTHLSAAAAGDRARKTQGTVEVYAIEPDGSESRIPVPKARPKLAGPPAGTGDVETPF